jgi:hypothetical protein
VYKLLMNIGFLLLYALVLFFGLGPVLLADGSRTERLVALAMVLVIVFVLASAHRWFNRRIK